MKYLVFVILLLSNSCAQSQSQVKVSSKSAPSSSRGAASVALPAEVGDFRADMLNIVNFVRARGCKCGGKKMYPVPALTWNTQLEDAAITHASDMARNKFFDHVGSDGSEIDTRVERAGYKWMEVGENIAVGYDNITDTILGWIKSPSHCKQLMSPRITEMGVARNGKYWVQDFGKKRTW